MAKKEKKAKDPAKQALIREMIAMYKPETMADVQSILRDMFSSTIEEMLHAELDSELGYQKHDQGPKETTNRRNGSYPKTVHGELGDMEISVPRDREGEYEPVAIPKGTSDVSELERKVLSMYAKGTSDRDISDVINDIYGFRLSHETISNIVDRVTPMVIEWQNRTLEKVYPFVYMDCLQISVKTDRRSGKQAFYTALGIDAEGKKDCLGFWMSENEGAGYWLSVFDELKSRGIERLGFVCIDGLKGLEEAITETFPGAVVCRCMVHLVRNSTKYVPTKNRKEFCRDLKSIYGAVSEGEAEAALGELNSKWAETYPSAVKVWNDNFQYVQQLFEYPSDIRRHIYTTNMIESFNSQLRKVTNGKGAFPNKQAAMKILYLRTMDIMKKWANPISNWGIIRGKLDLLWGAGWDA